MWLILSCAVLSGLAGTLCTRASEGFTRWGYAIAALASYAAATAAMAWLVQHEPVGLVYAVWTGAAAVALVAIDRLFYEVRLSALQLAGVAATVVGIGLLGTGMGQ
ncbi:multidrug efflux SMR transporter [Streptomyces sp. HB132]|uniref:DMT family transporter n=1 Tax=Streptomyces sp. HB132 TaxID=767388 RepID=UPI001EF822B3|nr:SMR family transporter [Streptomyces sp. HB132]